MTNEELRDYAGQWVEIRLIDGETLIGRLVTDEREGVHGGPSVLEQPSAGPNEDPPRISIPSAATVTAIKAIAAPPETFD